MRQKNPKNDLRSRTVLRTFRIPRELDEVLEVEAKEQGRTRTELLLSLLTRYVGFDRYAHKFGFVTLNRKTFQALLDAIPDDELKEIAKFRAGGMKELSQFWFRKSDLESVLAAIDIFSKHLHGFEYTLSRDDKHMVVTMHSDLGMKFTLFASVFWEQAIIEALGLKPQVEMGENTVVLRFPISSRPGSKGGLMAKESKTSRPRQA